MKAFTLGSVGAVSLLVASALAVGCKKDEPPPPLPTAAPVTSSTATLELKPEDAGITPPADAGKPKPRGTGTGSSLAACCNALNQNAASAPNEQMKLQMTQLAAMCSAALKTGQVNSVISQALRTAGLPACK